VQQPQAPGAHGEPGNAPQLVRLIHQVEVADFIRRDAGMTPHAHVGRGAVTDFAHEQPVGQHFAVVVDFLALADAVAAPLPVQVLIQQHRVEDLELDAVFALAGAPAVEHFACALQGGEHQAFHLPPGEALADFAVAALAPVFPAGFDALRGFLVPGAVLFLDPHLQADALVAEDVVFHQHLIAGGPFVVPGQPQGAGPEHGQLAGKIIVKACGRGGPGFGPGRRLRRLEAALGLAQVGQVAVLDGLPGGLQG